MIRTADIVRMNGHNLNGKKFTLNPVNKATIANPKSPIPETI
jgi:hypothetical protein